MRFGPVFQRDVALISSHSLLSNVAFEAATMQGAHRALGHRRLAAEVKLLLREMGHFVFDAPPLFVASGGSSLKHRSDSNRSRRATSDGTAGGRGERARASVEEERPSDASAAIRGADEVETVLFTSHSFVTCRLAPHSIPEATDAAPDDEDEGPAGRRVALLIAHDDAFVEVHAAADGVRERLDGPSRMAIELLRRSGWACAVLPVGRWRRLGGRQMRVECLRDLLDCTRGKT